MSRVILPAMPLLMPIDAMAMAEAGRSRQAEHPPRDVCRLIERHESCVHFAVEFNGDGSARDRDVNATMVELRCDEVEQDVTALRRKYARHPCTLKALDAVDGL